MNFFTQHLATLRGHFYNALWRWHTYIGILIVPFILLLGLTGILMLASGPIDHYFNKNLHHVSVGENTLPPSALLNQVKKAYPDLKTQLYLPPKQADHTARFVLVKAGSGRGGNHGGHGSSQHKITVHINPYTGAILGEAKPGRSLYSTFKKLHGTLFLGDLGDAIIETIAGLSILILVSGLVLVVSRWKIRSLIPKFPLTYRQDWSRLHKSLGLVIALPLLLFLLSGLAWTNIWGGQIVQAWSSLPSKRYEPSLASETHQALNSAGVHQVAWAIEKKPLPKSVGNLAQSAVNIDWVVEHSQILGFDYYRVHFPQGKRSVWTISASTIAGDIQNPFKEQIVHIDQYTGEVLQEISFADYSLLGKAMAAFVPLHQGDLGLWNILLNIAICLLIVIAMISAVIMWWISGDRRKQLPKQSSRPIKGERTLAVTMIFVAVIFPLSALALIVIATVDYLLHRFKRVAKV